MKMLRWMKRRREGKNRDHRGLSLVELICAIAIFGVVCTAVGSVMVVSARTYGRGNGEIDLQQEAQLTVNQIADLIIDASEVEFDGTNLVITGKDAVYTVTIDGNTLRYTEARADGSGTNVGVITQGISAFEVLIDEEEFKNNGNVRMRVAFDVDGKGYDSWYTVTARNGDVVGSSVVGGEETASIVAESEITLEPNESYSVSATVYGSAADKTLSWTVSNNTSAGTYMTGNTITIGGDEFGDGSGDLILMASTNAKAADGVTPLATATVRVHVRRVHTVEARGVKVNGEWYAAGSAYKITATAAGTNLSRVLGAEAASQYAAYNPYNIDFTCAINGSTAMAGAYVKKAEVNIDAALGVPYVKVELLQELPMGSTLTVTAFSRHAQGNVAGVQTNRTGIAYADVYGVWTLERSSSPAHSLPDGGINRGSSRITTIGFLGDEAAIKEEIRDRCGATNVRMLNSWRYRLPDGTWSPWINLSDQGKDFKIQAGDTASVDILPHERYEVEIRTQFVNPNNINEVYWPIENVTPDAEYLSRSTVEPASAKLIVGDSSQAGVGTFHDPVELRCGDGQNFYAEVSYNYDMGPDWSQANFIGTDFDYFKSHIKPTVYQYSGLGTWTENLDVQVEVNCDGGIRVMFRGNNYIPEYDTFKVVWNWNCDGATYPYGQEDTPGEGGQGVFYFKLVP